MTLRAGQGLSPEFDRDNGRKSSFYSPLKIPIIKEADEKSNNSHEEKRSKHELRIKTHKTITSGDNSRK